MLALLRFDAHPRARLERDELRLDWHPALRNDHINRSSVIGNLRTRTPVACQTALATAPAVPVIPISPTPLVPRAFTCASCSSTRIASREGTSAFTGMWYSPKLGFIGRPDRGSMTACSCS